MPTNIGVEWCDGYEIHYASQPDSRAPVEGPMVVYFPIQKEAFASTFLSTPGLIDRNSPDFDPAARLVREKGSNDRFVITPEGIRTSNPHITGLTGIVERLMATGGLKEVFQHAELPGIRWDNIRLASIPLSSGLEEYREALRAEYRNGFVKARRYRIEDGEVENAVLGLKRHPWTRVQFMEMLRHPMVSGDFAIETPDWSCLVALANWTQYSPFLFSGYLAQTLAYGGAYSPWPVADDAKANAISLANQVFKGFGSDYRSLELHVCNKPWCGLFGNIAWDHTWIIFEPTMRTITILLATDSD